MLWLLQRLVLQRGGNLPCGGHLESSNRVFGSQREALGLSLFTAPVCSWMVTFAWHRKGTVAPPPTCPNPSLICALHEGCRWWRASHWKRLRPLMGEQHDPIARSRDRTDCIRMGWKILQRLTGGCYSGTIAARSTICPWPDHRARQPWTSATSASSSQDILEHRLKDLRQQRTAPGNLDPLLHFLEGTEAPFRAQMSLREERWRGNHNDSISPEGIVSRLTLDWSNWIEWILIPSCM